MSHGAAPRTADARLNGRAGRAACAGRPWQAWPAAAVAAR